LKSERAWHYTFDQLADAIDVTFARWDLAHMHAFTLADGDYERETGHDGTIT
jgi:hypothetical protein